MGEIPRLPVNDTDNADDKVNMGDLDALVHWLLEAEPDSVSEITSDSVGRVVVVEHSVGERVGLTLCKSSVPLLVTDGKAVVVRDFDSGAETEVLPECAPVAEPE